MKKTISPIITLTILLAFIAIVSYLGMISPEFDRFIDISYKVFLIVMFSLLIILICTYKLPKYIRSFRIKNKMTKQEYHLLKLFSKIDEPIDKECEFITFSDVNLAVNRIISFSRYDLKLSEPLSFSPEEREVIKKYRNQDNKEAKTICDYYAKCEEVIKIINKYYDERGNLKKD